MDSIKTALIIILLMISVIMDMRYYKVKNELCIFFAIIGILYNAFLEGAGNMNIYLLGLLAPFIILFPLYLLNMLGAGDIKLFCAIGALIGLGDILLSIAYSFLLGFGVALFIMVIRKNLISRLKKVYVYFKGCFLNMGIMPYEELKEDHDGKMHFTIPIALGTITVALLQM